MTHCLCHERGTRFSAVPGSTPNNLYSNRINVDQALKMLILEAYDNIYTSQLEDYLLQYAHRSALEILMHLKQTYGFINPT
jgi:hypothetical protein